MTSPSPTRATLPPPRGGDPRKRRRRRSLLLHAVILVVGVIAALPALETREAIGQFSGDMEGSHPIGIENETQRQLFYSLICMCGCPRETLGTCACNFAHSRREELHAQLADGMGVEAIQDAYVARFGPQALAVPRDKGAARLLWMAPLFAIVLGAVGLVMMLRRWRRRSDEEAPVALASKVPAAFERDDYDDKLDQELQELDRE